jgi:hypothetical protein
VAFIVGATTGNASLQASYGLARLTCDGGTGPIGKLRVAFDLVAVIAFLDYLIVVCPDGVVLRDAWRNRSAGTFSNAKRHAKDSSKL